METISFPVPEVTSCAFGGKDLDLLFITSGKKGFPELCELAGFSRELAIVAAEAPLGGALFVHPAGVKGKKAHSFPD